MTSLVTGNVSQQMGVSVDASVRPELNDVEAF